MNNMVNQLDLIDIYKVLHPTTTKCTFKCTQNIYQDKPHARSSVNKFTRIEIMQSILSNHNEVRIQKRKYIWTLNNTLPLN